MQVTNFISKINVLPGPHRHVHLQVNKIKFFINCYYYDNTKHIEFDTLDFIPNYIIFKKISH